MSTARTPQIMADAAYIILTSKSEFTTDNFFLVIKHIVIMFLKFIYVVYLI